MESLILTVGGWGVLVVTNILSFMLGGLIIMTKFWWKKTKKARDDLKKLTKTVVGVTIGITIVGGVVLTAAGVL